MGNEATGTSGFDYLRLFVENVSIWEIVLVGLLIWLIINPSLFSDFMNRVTKLKIGDLEVELQNLKAEVAESKQEIKVLENEIERELSVFDEVLKDVDANAPLRQLGPVREALIARARSLSDVAAVGDYLRPDATPEQLYAAAVTLRERRPTELFGDLVDCLDRLARERDLGGIRLNTVWTLTSALHRTLIAGIRDGAEPRISDEELRRTLDVLDRLERNPRVQGDRPDDPERGVRGPIRFARAWIDRGLGRDS